MFRRTFAVVSLTVILAACSDGVPTSPVVSNGPSFQISDGANGGTLGFFFLPPIVAQPDVTGEFNANVPPRVEICELVERDEPVGDETHKCSASVRTFTPFEISVDAVGELYHVGWQTSADDLNFLELYRIQVFIGAVLLGFRDVDPVETAQEVPKTQAPGIYVFKNGSNIPIKFRIETNVLCDTDAFARGECAVGLATTADGGTITTASGGVEFFEGSIPDAEGVVAVIVERLDITNCLTSDPLFPNLDIPEFGDCFRVRTEPEIPELEEPAIVALCFDAELESRLFHPQRLLVQIHRFDEVDGTVVALPRALSNLCGTSPDDLSFLSTNPIMRFVGVTWQAVRGILLPEPLSAANRGLGGLTSSFSRFRWALPARFEQAPPELQAPFFEAGDDQTALVSTAVAIPPAVKVVDFNGGPVQGATVHFEVSGGEGAVVPPGGAVVPPEPVVVTTGEDGIARVGEWIMGPEAGLNELDAFGFGISAGEKPFSDHPTNLLPFPLGTGTVTFKATACAPGFGTPNVDENGDMTGVMEDGEWDCADSVVFPVNLSGGGSDTMGTLFWMNDLHNLYLAVRVPRSSEDKVNSLRFDFDNDNDGEVAAGDDAIEFDGASDTFTDEFLTDKCTNRGQSGCGNLDTNDDGTSDGGGGFDNNGGFSVYELWHPLDSGDVGHDMSGDACADGVDACVSFYLTLRTGKGAQGNTQWPGFRDFWTITISDGSQ